MIAYKVIHKSSRRGSNYGLLVKNECRPWTVSKKILNALFPKYIKGKRTRYVKGSMGIMCFGSHENAVRFMDLYDATFKVIKVRGFYRLSGKGNFIRGAGSDPDYLIQAMKGNFSDTFVYATNPYDNIVCFKSVLSLE